MKFDLTPHMIECLKKAVEAGYETEMSEGYAFNGSCGTGRMNAATMAADNREIAIRLLEGKSPFKEHPGGAGLIKPGTYDLVALDQRRLRYLYRITEYARPEKADLAEEDQRALLEFKRAAEICYKASPLERLAMEAE